MVHYHHDETADERDRTSAGQEQYLCQSREIHQKNDQAEGAAEKKIPALKAPPFVRTSSAIDP